MKQPKTLRGVQPSAAVRAEYERRLLVMIDAMQASVLREVTAAYRRRPPEMAVDESPAAAVRAAIRRVTRRWLKRFDEGAPKLAAWFAQAASKRSDTALHGFQTQTWVRMPQGWRIVSAHVSMVPFNSNPSS